MIRELKEELAQLRSKLSTGGSIAGEQYSADTPPEQQMVSITAQDGTVKRVSKAEITEQLAQSEKLYLDLNQTWEEKLTKTEGIHKEREAALEELGISIEKGFVGLSTPKKMPHLVNLSDDPLLAECLVYNLKPGTTTVGNVESNPAPQEADGGASSSVDIRLNGSKILHDHCTFENVDGVVTVVPKDGAAIMVNGLRIESPQRLRSGYRVILGDFHIFRFNHPQEAREERAEQGSLLKYSVTADQLDSPTPQNGHGRSASTFSRALSEIDGESSPAPGSPMPFRYQGRDNDWSFARREAVTALLGPDQKISSLTDDELDVLFEDLQRVRAVRKARPEGRLFDSSNGGDDDTSSVSSQQLPLREKYLSNGTLDNFSLDTALTAPSTPHNVEEDEQFKQTRADMQEQLDKQKEEFENQLATAEDGNTEIADIRVEKAKMEEELRQAKEEMQKQLAEQKAEFTKQLADIRAPRRRTLRSDGKPMFTERDIYLAKHVLDHWRRHRYIAMAASALRNASTLKEAQVLSQQMERSVVFQFAVVDLGYTFGSSYDLVLNGVSAEEGNDPDLEDAVKPCLGVRVVDFKNGVVHLWSLEKLHARVRVMRQMCQYLDRPEYMQHFRLENPFEEACMPEYTRVGDADIPLAAVFECRVQDFTLDVFSPFTSSVVAIVRLSLEPSSAEAPSSTLKFNVVMHEMVGFSELEGTSVHAQLFIPGVSEEGGATTTSLVSDFGDGPVRFESVHSMSLPLSAPRESSLRVSIFAKVTSMHLDKLLSWDDMRDASVRPKLQRNHSRVPEHEYLSEERHDVFARVQVLEISEDGSYQPVEVVQNNTLDNGAYQLHQGLQRRIVLHLTHSSGDTLPWEKVTEFRAGQVHLLDKSGTVSDLDNGQADVTMPLVAPPVIRNNDDGTTLVKMVGQWDSSAHDSLLLDRPTVENYRVQISLKWQISSPRTIHPMKFNLNVAVQTRPRTWFRQNSLLAQLWQNTRVVHSCTANYSITLKPTAAKRAGDLWRMDTTGEYISGEEMLNGWAPRGMSLIRDFIDLRRRQRRTAEIEAAKGVLLLGALTPPLDPISTEDVEPTEEQKALLKKFIDIWRIESPKSDALLMRSNTATPEPSHVVDENHPDQGPPLALAAQVEHHPKTIAVLKSGWLLSPDHTGTRWVKRFCELRRPYLHLYSSEGDEVAALNLTNSRIDAEPQVANLLQRDNMRMEVWAVYATNKAWLFAARNDRERGEWIWAVDRSYVLGNGE
jgi:kinesin family protein 1